MRAIADEASCHLSGLLHKLCGLLHWFSLYSRLLALFLPPRFLKTLAINLSLLASFWLGSLHGGDGATHLIVHQAIYCSHGNREITNSLPPKFRLSPPLQSRHEIKEFVLIWYDLYVQHQGIEFLDIVPHRSGVSEPFQHFSVHLRSVSREELILQFLLQNLSSGDLGPFKLCIVFHPGSPP